ncbi:hypothetical protein KIW84_045088 [Lathyrus oleraceus]|uniref:Uncharacterized protein n=1 Tax=Pisum sativum TaxID=3888 RepID=A0A9D4XM89_PEA|nr:hypothetical protein KIW84_045088 [Pisum sativum]
MIIVIAILGHRNCHQIQQIRRAYEEIYQEDLIKRLEFELKGDFEKALYRWILEPADRDVVLANVAIKSVYNKGVFLRDHKRFHHFGEEIAPVVTIANQDLIYGPSLSWFELIEYGLIWKAIDLGRMSLGTIFTSFRSCIIGRAIFTNSHEWILLNNFAKDAYPPEVYAEMHLQFSAGMQTICSSSWGCSTWFFLAYEVSLVAGPATFLDANNLVVRSGDHTFLIVVFEPENELIVSEPEIVMFEIELVISELDFHESEPGTVVFETELVVYEIELEFPKPETELMETCK